MWEDDSTWEDDSVETFTPGNSKQQYCLIAITDVRRDSDGTIEEYECQWLTHHGIIEESKELAGNEGVEDCWVPHHQP